MRLFLIIIFLFIVSKPSFACRVIQNAERQNETIENALFIGLVTTMRQTKDDETKIEKITFEPCFVYKSKPDFNIKKVYTIEIDRSVLTSCDYNLRPPGHLTEVILLKDSENKIFVGNRFHMALGDKWHELREDVKYIEQKKRYINQDKAFSFKDFIR